MPRCAPNGRAPRGGLRRVFKVANLLAHFENVVLLNLTNNENYANPAKPTLCTRASDHAVDFKRQRFVPLRDFVAIATK